MINMRNLILLPMLSLMLQSCHSQDNYNYPIEYDLTNADTKLVLADELNEVSSIALSEDEKHIACITDEMGILYIISPEDGSIQQRIDFHKDGDYEGIEIIGKEIFIMKSSGTIYHIEDYMAEQPLEFTKYNTELSTANDVEGLGYDPENKHLLMACKASPDLDTEISGKEQERAIYKFDLNSKKLITDSAIRIHRELFKEYIEQTPDHPAYKKWMKRFGEEAENFRFEPSAIAVQKSTGRTYMLSSVGKMLAVFEKDGRLHTLIKLNKSDFIQPEGICFDKAENLYICNEGKDKQAIVYKFNRKSN